MLTEVYLGLPAKGREGACPILLVNSGLVSANSGLVSANRGLVRVNEDLAVLPGVGREGACLILARRCDASIEV